MERLARRRLVAGLSLVMAMAAGHLNADEPATRAASAPAAARAAPEIRDVVLAPGVAMQVVRIPLAPASQPSTTQPQAVGDAGQPPSIWMGRGPVTIAQFRVFVEATGYQTDAERAGSAIRISRRRLPDGRVVSEHYDTPGTSWRTHGFAQADDHPVVLVTWSDAIAFCDWMSRKVGVAVRLPRESEWEYVASGGDGRTYAWGDTLWPPAERRANLHDLSAERDLDRTSDNPFFEGYDDGYVWTSPIHAFPPNEFELWDVAGNVTQWCLDPVAGPRIAAGRPLATAPTFGSQRVLRGASWAGGGPYYGTIAYRKIRDLDDCSAMDGFRIVAERLPVAASQPGR